MSNKQGYNKYILLDEKGNYVTYSINNADDFVKLIKPNYTVLYKSYNSEYEEIFSTTISYEDFWEKQFLRELFYLESLDKLYVPQPIKDFYKGTKTEDDWYIFQCDYQLELWQQMKENFINTKALLSKS